MFNFHSILYSCAIEATLTAGGNIEFILIAHTNTTNCGCSEAARNMTGVFNGTMNETSVPPVYNLIVGAVEAQAAIEVNTAPSPTPTPGSGSGMVTFSIFTLMVTLFITVLGFMQ